LLQLCVHCSDELDEQQSCDALQLEQSKPASQQDKPRLRKLFRATFTVRRNFVITAERGGVSQLVEKYPLLADMEFVSIALCSPVTMLVG